jgi:hypothetical protein
MEESPNWARTRQDVRQLRRHGTGAGERQLVRHIYHGRNSTLGGSVLQIATNSLGNHTLAS